jgi:tetratricopeptide (TPR) repeat protein
MGAVYRARHVDHGLDVAIKILSREAAAIPQRVERFRSEARNTARLRHPNIVRLLDFGEHHGSLFLAMELVDGPNLQDYLQQHGPMPVSTALSILTQIGQALDYAHKHQIIHRDIKPGNVLLMQQDDAFVAKLADLGVARCLEDAQFRLTSDGHTVGTIDYMAPEQAQDSSAADIRSDLYSLGCTLFHMLASAPPFASGSLAERLHKHAEVPVPDLCQINPAVSRHVRTLCERLLAKNPAHRFQTPAELLQVLQGRELRALATKDGPKGAQPVLIARQAKAASISAQETTIRRVEGRSRQAQPITAASKREALAGKVGKHSIATQQFQRAQQLLSSGETAYALQLLATCCDMEPSNAAYREALRQAERAHVPENAQHGWQSWLITLPSKLRLWMAHWKERHEQAIHFADRVLARRPADLSALLFQAQAAIALGWLDWAIWQLEFTSKDYPCDLRVLRALALAHERRRDLEAAIAVWKRVDTVDPANAEAIDKIRNLSARSALHQGRYQERARERGDAKHKSPTHGLAS